MFTKALVQMRTVAMCFSHLQLPRCRIHTFKANSWRGHFHYSSRRSGECPSTKVFCSNKYIPEGGGYSRRWISRTVTAKSEERGNESISSVADIKRELLSSETTSTSITQYYDIEQVVDENSDVSNPLTLIVFDIETTGFSREKERIIEIAMQDLQGGENSTFQTLVNPGRPVTNSDIHGIDTDMVREQGVPRMEELIPILLKYVTSRQKPGGYVVLVAHNARSFDVPFLINEFKRCASVIPSEWLFSDTCPLAREAMKSLGLESSSVSLQALRQHYKIPLIGPAHRAMQDVRILTSVFHRLMSDLQLPISELVARHTFRATDCGSSKNKKKKKKESE